MIPLARRLIRVVGLIALSLGARDAVAQAPYRFTSDIDPKPDPAAALIVGLMTQGCVFNHADAAAVRTWAEEHRYLELTDSASLKALTGSATDIAGWALPTRFGRLVIVTHAATKECVVYAEKARTGDVRALFSKAIHAVRSPKVIVTTTEEPVQQTPQGAKHVERYKVVASGQRAGVIFIAATIDRPGGPYQAMLVQQPFVDDAPMMPAPKESQ